MQAEEIKALRLARQHLVSPVSMQQAVQDLCGVQAQFLSNAMHALQIRSFDFSEEHARNELLKSWTLRGTMHVFAQADLALMLHEGRGHLLRPCDTLEADEFISKERKVFFADLIVSMIGQGKDEREVLKEICTSHGMTEAEGESVFNAWGGTIRALCEAGRICHVTQERKAFRLCPDFTPLEKDAAGVELARRYFTHYGLATVRDAAYFFGETQKQIKSWMDQLPLEASAFDGKTFYHLPCDDDQYASVPDCLFLAGFDPLMLGYEKKESLFLPQEYLRGIFNLAGIVMPAVLLRGSVAGRWKKTGKRLNVMMFKNMATSEKRLIEEKAYDLWGDGIRLDITNP